MWRDCGDWKTDEFRGYPEFSWQTFAHVYEHASDELLVWVRNNGTGTGVRWLHDLARYVRHRSKAEGRGLGEGQVLTGSGLEGGAINKHTDLPLVR